MTLEGAEFKLYSKGKEFEAKKQRIFDAASKIRIRIQALQKSIGMMGFELYGFPRGLGK